jgi:hypothetical protein
MKLLRTFYLQDFRRDCQYRMAGNSRRILPGVLPSAPVAYTAGEAGLHTAPQVAGAHLA